MINVATRFETKRHIRFSNQTFLLIITTNSPMIYSIITAGLKYIN